MTNKDHQYTSWPLGQVPEVLQRPELKIIKEQGYQWNDPRDVISIFEGKVAKFAGAEYAVCVDSCTSGVFLSLKYLQHIGELTHSSVISIPSRTYVSIPMQIKHVGCAVKYQDIAWSGLYQLAPTRIWDSAVRWTKDMYIGGNALQVISFQTKKRIPIGKGGIILTNDQNAAEWLRLAAYDGRDLTRSYTDNNHVKMIGYHMYMTPEDAARGIILMDIINKNSEVHVDSQNSNMYPDISKINI